MACMFAGTGSMGVMAAEKITEAKAKEIALEDAGLSVNEVSGLRCEKDYDDGREIYDVEFRKGGYEYSYDIDAHTYSVLDWDKDYDD